MITTDSEWTPFVSPSCVNTTKRAKRHLAARYRELIRGAKKLHGNTQRKDQILIVEYILREAVRDRNGNTIKERENFFEASLIEKGKIDEKYIERLEDFDVAFAIKTHYGKEERGYLVDYSDNNLIVTELPASKKGQL